MAVILTDNNSIELNIVCLRPKYIKNKEGHTEHKERGDVLGKKRLLTAHASALFKKFSDKKFKRPQTQMHVIPLDSPWGLNEEFELVKGGEYYINHFFVLAKKKDVIGLKANTPVQQVKSQKTQKK